jgi:hypothetical protein
MPKNDKTPAKIIQDENEPVPTEILAKSVVAVSAAAQKLLAGGLTMRALMVLIHDQTAVPLAHIKLVLESAGDLAKQYTRNR